MIAPEGKIILIPASVLLLVLGFLSFKAGNIWFKTVYVLDFIFVIFSLYFFRDPERDMPTDESLFVSPADGKVVQIIDVNDPEVGQAKQISIFLSVFNVHKQVVPMTGKILHSIYNKGKFLAAWDHKASMDNEQTEVLIETETGLKYKVKQIFSNIASLIECKLLTGRTHQIRVHLSASGNSLIGDKKYGKNKSKLLKNVDKTISKEIITFERQALHAYFLSFIHPTKNKKIQIKSELPSDFKYLIDKLKLI